MGDHAAVVKRIFSSFYHNRNSPSSTKFRYPFVVRNPLITEHKLKNFRNTKSPAATAADVSTSSSSSILRNLMENMSDDEIINEIINMEMDKAVVALLPT